MNFQEAPRYIFDPWMNILQKHVKDLSPKCRCLLAQSLWCEPLSNGLSLVLRCT